MTDDSPTESHDRVTRRQRVMQWIVRFQQWILCGLIMAGGAMYYFQPMGNSDEQERVLKLALSEKAKLELKRDQLIDQINWVKQDPAYREIILRDRKSLKKPEETILQTR